MFYVRARYNVLIARIILHTIYGLCHGARRFRRARHRALCKIRHHRNRHHSRGIRSQGRRNRNHRKFLSHGCAF